MKEQIRKSRIEELRRRPKAEFFAHLGMLCSIWTLTVVVAAGEESGPGEESVIRAGDSISISVFGEPSLERNLIVGPSGRITYPLLGALTVTGKAPSEFALEIEKLLETNYIKDAHVSVAVVDRALQKISVIGEVQIPGVVEFPADGDFGLFAAVAGAGGTTERADSSRIQIKRRTGSKVTSVDVSLDSNRTYHLEPGDTIIVPALHELPAVTVMGQVKKPGALPMTRGNEVDLLEAIAITGGFTEFARPSKVRVRRDTASGTKTFTVDASRMQEDGEDSFILSPGDTIIVPNRIF